MDITLRTLTENDLPFVKDIYDYYTLHTTVVYFVHCASIDELKNYIPVGDPVYRSFIIETPEGDFGRERSQHPPVRKMRFRVLCKHPAGSGEVRQKTGFEDVSENYFRQFTSHSLKADDKNTSTQEVLFKSESTIR